MDLITRQSLANIMLKRWMKQYPSGKWAHKVPLLKDLGDTPDPDAIDAIIGNDSWPTIRCDECRAYASVVQLGQEPDYDTSTACICESCLKKALQLFSER